MASARRTVNPTSPELGRGSALHQVESGGSQVTKGHMSSLDQQENEDVGTEASNVVASGEKGGGSKFAEKMNQSVVGGFDTTSQGVCCCWALTYAKHGRVFKSWKQE